LVFAMLGFFPYDTFVTEAMVQGQPVTAFEPDGLMSSALREVWVQVRKCLNGVG